MFFSLNFASLIFENHAWLREIRENKFLAKKGLYRIFLKTTYFQFDNTLYPQLGGAAMGSPVSPIVANLFMDCFEEINPL